MAVAKVSVRVAVRRFGFRKGFRVESDTVRQLHLREGFLVITREFWEIFFWKASSQLSDEFFGQRSCPARG